MELYSEIEIELKTVVYFINQSVLLAWLVYYWRIETVSCV